MTWAHHKSEGLYFVMLETISDQSYTSSGLQERGPYTANRASQENSGEEQQELETSTANE